jgi:hypothetical protein
VRLAQRLVHTRLYREEPATATSLSPPIRASVSLSEQDPPGSRRMASWSCVATRIAGSIRSSSPNADCSRSPNVGARATRVASYSAEWQAAAVRFLRINVEAASPASSRQIALARSQARVRTSTAAATHAGARPIATRPREQRFRVIDAGRVTATLTQTHDRSSNSDRNRHESAPGLRPSPRARSAR